MWLTELFAKRKTVIGMVHLKALPGTPLYDERAGMDGVLGAAEHDLVALQDGGIDGVMFCNENDRPYLLAVTTTEVAAMSAVVGALKSQIKVPFGVDILWDPTATISVACATGASFAREVFTGTYASDMGLWSPDAGAALRHRKNISATGVRLLFNINAEFASPLGSRPLEEVARSVAFGCLPDALCVSGSMTGHEVDLSALEKVKRVAGGVPVFANTGVRADSVERYLSVADGAIVGTALKVGGITWNPVDKSRVQALMAAARRAT
jgi:hypothetical protein